MAANEISAVNGATGARTERAGLGRALAMEIAGVTERAAVAAALWRGRGDEKAADQAAVDAMRREFNRLAISGTVMIGEGERDEAPMLFVGEKVGKGGVSVDIALDPLEGTTLCAKNQPNSLTVVAVAEAGGLLHAPDIYMQKIAIGPGYPEGLVDLDRPASENLAALAKAKGVAVSELTVCILDRPRHARLIDEVRAAGASIRLIGDGDIAGIIHVADPDVTGIDIYLGSGGAPEGVLAAAALRTTGGQMQGRLIALSEAQRMRADKLGIKDLDRKFSHHEMAKGEVVFAATGVTDGNLLSGVRFSRSGDIQTESVVMHSASATIRWFRATHRRGGEFETS